MIKLSYSQSTHFGMAEKLYELLQEKLKSHAS